MRYLLSIFFLAFCLSFLSAQEKHFVFIQSENNQPFYVFLNGKLYSSTTRGHLIIPKLTDGNYSFSIGFAQNAFPEQNFQYKIDKKDLGFNLKNFGEKGWGLFDLQSFAIIMAVTSNTNDVAKAISEKTTPKENDEPLISFNKKKRDTVAAPVQTEIPTDTLTNDQVVKSEKPTDSEVEPGNTVAELTENNNISADAQAAAKRPDIEKVSEIKEADGVHMAYAEVNGKKQDTINVIVPLDKSLPKTENNFSSSQADTYDSSVASSTKPDKSESGRAAKKDSLKFLDIEIGSEKDINQENAVQENSITSITHGKCKNVATDEDYARLRRKMAMETTDEKMINEAKKIYRNKCFTTSQIRRLSTLFLSDEGRFNFFNASYNSVTDVSQYSMLESEFIDPAFVSRFKTLFQ